MLVNMSVNLHSNNSFEKIKFDSKVGGISRIKFKSLSNNGHRIYASESSRYTIHSKKSLTKGSSLSFSKSQNDDLAELLDPNYCYHPQCCFAYNITDDVRRPSLITECLPYLTYQRLAALWGLDPHKAPRLNGNTCRIQNVEEENKQVEEFLKNVERDIGMRTDISEDMHVNPCSINKSILKAKSKKDLKENPYLKFLKKTEVLDTKQKTTSNLGKKAGKITKMIINNFLEWYQSLGGNDGETFIEESTLQELFQIGFDMPAAKALVIRIKEMPTVPDCLAVLRNEPKHATRYGLKQFLKKDIKMENTPPKMLAFGKLLPKERPILRYKPPRNFVKKTWMECLRVPSDLDTMKTVWSGLERLRSTIAFTNWLKNHPEITPPSYLEEKGLLKINYEEWNQMYKGFEMDADKIEVIMSDMKILHDKLSIQESKFSALGSLKYDSTDSF